MKNRKNLHDCGLVLVVLGILNLFSFISTVLITLFDGTMDEGLAAVEPGLLTAVKVVLVVLAVLLGFIVVADVFLGVKALNVSKTPTADKGYITVAKVFFIMSIIATVSAVCTLFGDTPDIADAILNFANAGLNSVVYFLFIKAASDVRRDVLNGEI